MQEKLLTDTEINYKEIKEKITEAAKSAGRDPGDIRLMAVTKTVAPEKINIAINSGCDLLGENRVQEFLEKYESYDKRAEIHFIGRLQTNKVKYIVDKVCMIHSLDSLGLAAEIEKQAAKHNLVCLLHEKPFAGVNGSGKHNNWSLSTDTGANLLSPGETPYENAQFLLLLCAVIQAVDDYQGLLRASVATAGNDHRLGANEAPPAVVSIFLGDELTAILDAIETDTAYTGVEKKKMKLGVDVLPRFIRDTTDRNRTSPFAFTGNKFEFRMLGSSNSIACANIMLNAAVAESLKLYADELEKAEDFNTALHELIKNTIKAHKRIIFNGNGYDDAWITEATEKRGLLNLRTTPDAIPEILKKKNVDMLTSHKVFSEAELHSRYEIMLENYCKTVCIEAQTMSDMARKQILPAVERYAADVADAAASKKTLDAEISCCYEKKLVKKLAALIDSIDSRTDALDGVIAKLKTLSDVTEEANYIRDEMISRMTELRAAADEAEVMTAESYWPFPTYGDLLFGVK